mmetsp:Transcript_105813/g.329908  ORF Transcript_105813/g.329908 Transcript_105813/m.329908 type:complete len:299 (-) Transcript_105813:358-1254(-)
MVDLCHGLEALHGARVGAVPTEHEVLPDVVLGQDLRDLRVRGVPAVAHEDAAPRLVDVLHVVLREFHPLVLQHSTLEAPDDAVDLLHAVVVQHLDKLADHVVEAGAQAAAGDDGRRAARLLGVEVDLPLRPAALHLEVRPHLRVAAAPAVEGLRGPAVGEDALRPQGCHHGAVDVLAGEAVLEHHALQPDDLGARLQQAGKGYDRGVGLDNRPAVLPWGVDKAVRLKDRLPRREQHPAVPAARAIDTLLHAAHHLHRKVGEALVDLGRRDASQARHGAMHRMLGEGAAIDAVVCVCLH